jgi:AcrR family transcriptional regulator
MVNQGKTNASKAKKAPAKDGVVKKRRSPITRAEGERRLIEAAAVLLAQKPFSEVGVRDIALLADVNHGFVHTWFGSKNDLIIRVIKHLLADMVTRAEGTEAGAQAINPGDPNVRLAVRLLIWLDLEGINSWEILQDQPIIQVLTERYVTIEGLSAKDAGPAAVQATAVGIAASSFGRVLIQNNVAESADLGDVFDLWRHILGLLAKHPRP